MSVPVLRPKEKATSSMKSKVNCIITAIWKHSNLPIQFSEEWEWTEDINDDLNAGFYGWVNPSSTADILRDFIPPKNWEVLSTSNAPFDLEEYQADKVDMSKMSVFMPSQVSWSSYLDTLIVPFRFDLNTWMEIDTQERLIAMGQVESDQSFRSDGVLFTELNSGYFDYYVSGAIELSIEVDSVDGLKAKQLAAEYLRDYLATGFSKEMRRLLPEFKGDPNFDESIDLYLIPNWVLIQSQ